MTINYPPNMTLRPLVTWTQKETRNRQRSNFSAPWSSTLDLLDRELQHLGPGRYHAESVLQIALREQDFRIDGMPRANAIPTHPGVILNVESTKGPLSFPCDKFDRWQDNLRAIALGLEALRKIDRYGITPGNEQYQGWRAIEAKPSEFDGAESALQFLAIVAGTPTPPTRDRAKTIYRAARAKTHPDSNNGDREQWNRVESAGQLLAASEWIT